MDDLKRQELKRLREQDDRWTGSRLLVIAASTVAAALTFIYIVSGFNGGH